MFGILNDFYEWLRYEKLKVYKNLNPDTLKPDIKSLMEAIANKENKRINQESFEVVRHKVLRKYAPNFHQEIEDSARFGHQFSIDIKELLALKQLWSTNKITHEEYLSINRNIMSKYSSKDQQDLEKAVQEIEHN